MFVYFILLIFTFQISKASSLYEHYSNVIQLDDNNFDELVTKDAIWIVQFYSPNCPHCRAFVPEYARFAKALKGIVKVGAVDGDKNPRLRHVFQLRKYPAVLLFPDGPFDAIEYPGKYKAKQIGKELGIFIENRISKKLGLL